MNSLKRICFWLWEGKYLFSIPAIVLAVLWIDDLYTSLKPHENIKLYGLLLQLWGIVEVFLSLGKKLQPFKGIGLKKYTLDYFKRFPWKVTHVKVQLRGAFFGTSSMSARLKGIDKTEDTFDSIRRYINKEIEFLNETIEMIRKDIISKIEVQQQLLDKLKVSVEKDLNNFESKIIETSVSDVFYRDIFGLSCILFGTIYSTIPEWIVKIS